IRWIGITLIAYLVLSHISVYGIGKTPQLEALITFQTLLGAKFGSLMTLGIGPIVTAGILLQLLVGSKIINWDMTEEEGREKFQAWNKFLAVLLCFIEGAAFILAGAIPAASRSYIIFIILQLAAGGTVVMLLDEIVSKWGFGSGISLFIAAGVASQIFIGLFSPFVAPNGRYVGNLIGFIASLMQSQTFLITLSYILPVITTVIVFLVVIYVQDIRIDVPLSFTAMRGFGRTWSLKLLYTSNIPVILTAALIANLQLMGTFGLPATKEGCSALGCWFANYAENQLKGGVVYFLTSPRSLVGDVISYFMGQSVKDMRMELLRGLTYLIFLSISAMIFSIFWISTSGMDSASVAEQIESIGMYIPGYRPDKKTMEGVLQKYIPALAVMGGLAVGLLAAMADFTGAIGTGTGILLTVMIIYNYYEELSVQKLDDAHPLVRKVLGE
ncbi:preprotein translocase subunit SecY, partial [archaeon]|nr:preprotein translocase subunit SecY [archaeon]